MQVVVSVDVEFVIVVLFTVVDVVMHGVNVAFLTSI